MLMTHFRTMPLDPLGGENDPAPTLSERRHAWALRTWPSLCPSKTGPCTALRSFRPIGREVLGSLEGRSRSPLGESIIFLDRTACQTQRANMMLKSLARTIESTAAPANQLYTKRSFDPPESPKSGTTTKHTSKLSEQPKLPLKKSPEKKKKTWPSASPFSPEIPPSKLRSFLK